MEGLALGCAEEVFDSISKMCISNITEEFIPTSTNEKKQKDLEEAPGINFFPSVCIQRYNKVREVLQHLLTEGEDTFPVTVIEFGCAELRLHQHLKALHGRLQKLIYVDKDEDTLDVFKQRIRPLSFEYLRKRETPLSVEVYSGCATTCDPRLLHNDISLYAVIGVEIIEHLDPEILTGFERTVFGLLNPPVVILTTPNADFNVVFKLPPGSFRHWDHRFEWTRAEFHHWCEGICLKYPGYSFTVYGIGSGPLETLPLGCVSQMAVFRKDKQVPTIDPMQFNDIIQPQCYKLLAFEEYPWFVDDTPREEQIVRGFQCHISNYILNYTSIQDYRMDEKTEVSLPLEAAKYITGMPKGIEDLEEVRIALLNAGYVLRQNIAGYWEIILKVPEDEDDPSDEEMESDEHFAEYSHETTPSNTSQVTIDDEEW